MPQCFILNVDRKILKQDKIKPETLCERIFQKDVDTVTKSWSALTQLTFCCSHTIGCTLSLTLQHCLVANGLKVRKFNRGLHCHKKIVGSLYLFELLSVLFSTRSLLLPPWLNFCYIYLLKSADNLMEYLQSKY